MPAPAEAATRGDCPQLHAILKRYGLPPKIFGPIAHRESRCSWTSISAIRKSTGRPDVGLLQIQGSWRTVTRQICHLKPGQDHIRALTRPDCQLRVAAYLYADGKGLGHGDGPKTKGGGGMRGGGGGGRNPDADVVNEFSDYRKTDDGFVFPYTVTTVGMGASMNMEKIEVNKAVDPKLYKPEKL